jgi:ketosteroid isomerase-like protein
MPALHRDDRQAKAPAGRQAARRVLCRPPAARGHLCPGNCPPACRIPPAAAADGDVAGLERLLADDVVYWGDGGGSKLPVARKPVAGRCRVARLFGKLFPRYLADSRYALEAGLSVVEVNGQPAALGWSGGTLAAVLIPEIDGGKIAALRIVADPGKLAFASRQLAGLSRSGSRAVT